MAISYPALPYLKRLSSGPRCPIYLAKLPFDTSLNALLQLQETKARCTLHHGSLQRRVNIAGGVETLEINQLWQMKHQFPAACLLGAQASRGAKRSVGTQGKIKTLSSAREDSAPSTQGICSVDVSIRANHPPIPLVNEEKQVLLGSDSLNLFYMSSAG